MLGKFNRKTNQSVSEFRSTANYCGMVASLVSAQNSHWPRSLPLKAAWLRSCVRQVTSPKPRLAPWPAKGCTRWAASLHKQSNPHFSKYFKHDWYTEVLSVTFLPNQSYPVSDVLWCMTHPQRKHDPGLRANRCHTWGKLSRGSCGWHDDWQGTAEQRTSCLNQLRLVLITPLLGRTHRGAREQRDIFRREWKMARRAKTETPLSRQKISWHPFFFFKTLPLPK